MNTGELFADLIQRNAHMFTESLKDFTDADIFVRPTPAANHAAWQIGHLIAADFGMLSACGAKMPELPAGFAERFNKETSKSDDAKAFGSKTELLGLFNKSTEAAAAFARGLTPADMEKPCPEAMRSFAPTVGHLVALRNSHVMMHLGQIQVIRRKLGKPVIF